MDKVRFALRTLSRAPGFTVAAVLALALGVGGSTAMFSVLRGVVLKPLAPPHPEELVRLYQRPAGSEARYPFSAPDYIDLAKGNGAFQSIAGIRAERQTLTGRGSPIQIRVARVTGSFFSILRQWPSIGRAPGAEEDVAGGSRTVVLTDGFWRREFGADPSAVGRTLVLDGRVYVIGGVMPPDFRFPLLRQAEVLVPAAFDRIELERRDHSWITVVGRLKAGFGIREAQADLDRLAPRLAEQLEEHNGWRQEAQLLLDDLVGPLKPALIALQGAVLLVLLIACANVASMLLARGMARQRELAIRAALGGGRGELVGHLLIESMFVALAGGALGMVLAAWGLDALLALSPKGTPRLDEVHLDAAALGFALLISIVAGLLAGLAPALQVTQPRLMDVLRNGASGSGARARARSALVVAEMALALVLAAGAGLMIRTLAVLLDVRTGLASPERVLVADLDLPEAQYGNDGVSTFAQQLLQRVSAVPGVRSSALLTNVPLDPRTQSALGFRLEGGEQPPPGQTPKAEAVWATPGYLETMGIPLLRGRGLRWTDSNSTPRIVLVNEAFVRRHIPNGEPLGRRVLDLLAPNDAWEIAGVIGDVHTKGLDLAPAPLVVIPLLQFPVTFLRIAVRAEKGDPLQLLPPLRAEVLALDKNLPISAPQPLSQVVIDSLGERRFQVTLLSVFALVALALAALGIYGVMAYSVAQRSREIGIRMALGAAPRRVLGMVVAGGLRLAAAGVGLGIIGALAATRVLSALVYGVSTTDPLTLASTAAVLIVSAALASWIPARRATRLDPTLSLRAE